MTLQQRLGNYNVFISFFRQMLIDNYVKNLNDPLQTHTELVFNVFGSIQFHDYLSLVTQPKFRYSLVKLRLSSHSLAMETGGWNKLHPIPFGERKCCI